MNKEILNKCGKTADKIVNIVEGMGFTTEKRVNKWELNTLIAIEVRNLLNDVVTDFYKNCALVPVEPEVVEEEGCCGGGCGCHEEKSDEETNTNN